MITLNLVQGTSNWLAARAKHFTASEAPAMLGLSKYKSRSELLREKATGIVAEVDAATQRRFNAGHESEAATRVWAEQFIGEDLYPITGAREVDGLPLLASFDGLTLDESINWENKLWNEEFASMVRDGIVPDTHWPQLEQQLLVAEAKQVLFTVSDGGENIVHLWYESIPERRTKLIAGWKQFAEDVKNYKHVEVISAAVANPIRDFPAVKYEVVGMSLKSNVTSEVKPYVLSEVAKFEKKPETDQEFADLDGFTKKARSAVKKSVLLRETVMAGLVDFDQFFRDMQEVEGILTKAAISGENLFKAEKINRKQALITKSREAYGEYWAALCKRIGGQWIPAKEVTYWSDAIKGLSSMKSIESELGAALANAKIEASAIADKIQENEEAARELMHLFPDFGAMCQKEPADFKNLIIARQAEAERRENSRLESERARIRAEEQAKAERDAQAKARAEQAEWDAEAARLAHELAEREAVKIEAEQAQGRAALAESMTVIPVIEQNQQVADVVTRSFPSIEEQKRDPIDDGKTLKLGEISSRLGFSVTADFMAQLGFQPVATEKSAKLYLASDFGRICVAIINHIQSAMRSAQMAA